MFVSDYYQGLDVEKILIAGIDNAGKSSIQDVLKYVPQEAIQRRTPSKDMEISRKIFLKKNYTFFIPPGQKSIRINELHGTMQNEYFESVNTFIFVVDAADIGRFNEVREELLQCINDLKQFSPTCQNFILFAHKQDLANALDGLNIKKEILDPLLKYAPEIINQFSIYETTLFNPETIHEPFIKAIAKHVGLNRIDFEELATWVRKQTNAKIVLITDSDGLLIGESYIGKENPLIYAAYIAKIFSAIEAFQTDFESNGVKIIVLEDEDEINYSVISRINCTKNDYLAMLIGYPKTHIGMSRIINRNGLEKLKEAYENYHV